MKMSKITQKRAPNFKLPSTNTGNFELNKIKTKYKVLYFYPKDNTPGCTIETKDFNSLLSQFRKLDCEVIGISKDIPTKPSMFEILGLKDKIQHHLIDIRDFDLLNQVVFFLETISCNYAFLKV